MAAEDSRMGRILPQGQVTIQASTLIGVLTIGLGGWQSVEGFQRQQDELASAVRDLGEQARETKTALEGMASASDDTLERLHQLEQWRAKAEPTLALCLSQMERRR